MDLFLNPSFNLLSKRCETALLYKPPEDVPRNYTLGISVIVKSNNDELDPINSPIYSRKNTILPGTCYFTQTGTACQTIYHFYCEGPDWSC